jgi:nucleoside-diphosphate-sugar epimerase
MRVFVTGASGALGSRLVSQLIDAGHQVIGTHHSPASAELLRTLGAKPVLINLLDAHAVRRAVLENEPEAIVHQATALANAKFSRNLDKTLARTNELRTKGTDALLAAAREASVRRFVAQSGAAYGRYARQGGPIKTEDDPLAVTPPADMQQSAAARSVSTRGRGRRVDCRRLTQRAGRGIGGMPRRADIAIQTREETDKQLSGPRRSLRDRGTARRVH